MHRRVRWRRGTPGPVSARGSDADVGHHAAVLVLADVAVVDEVSRLGEGNSDNHGGNPAASVAPLPDCSIAGGASVGDGDIIHALACVAGRGVFGQHKELGLVHMEVVRLGRDVDQLPLLGDRRVVRAERETDADDGWIEGSDVFEGAGDGMTVLVHLLIAEALAVGV